MKQNSAKFLILVVASPSLAACETARAFGEGEASTAAYIWILMLVSGGFIGVLLGLYRIRVRALRSRSRELEAQVEERTQALEEQTRLLQERRMESERRREELAALYRADEELYRSLGLSEVLKSMVETAVDILHADKCVLMVWDARVQALNVAAAHGFMQETIAKINIARGQGIAGIVAETGEPIIVEDADTDQRVSREIVDAEGICSFIQVPIKVAGEFYGVLSADYTNQHRFEESEQRLLMALAQRAGVAIRNARLFEDTRARLAQVAALQETTRAIASTLDLKQLLDIIIQQATSLLGADGGMINVVDWESREDEVVAASGMAKETIGDRESLELNLSGWVTLNKQAVISNDVPSDERVSDRGMEFVQQADVTSGMIAPLIVKDRVMGTLVVVGTKGGKETFESSELDVLVSFANQAAIAIENAQLYAQAKQYAVVEERQRLARELHDSVTQALYGMTLYAEAMARQLDLQEFAQAREQLSELQSTAQEALREMRLLIFQLRPPNLEKDGLVTILRNRLEAVEARAGIEAQFTVDQERRLPLEIEEGLYRIAQEALNNALKHAAADRVVVNLVLTEPAIVLEICDDGVGFDPDAGLEAAGLGMDGMYERAAEMGGKLIVESSPNSGSKIRVEVPR